MSAPRALFFDLDDTLIDAGASYRLGLSRTCEELEHAYPGFPFGDLFAAYRHHSNLHFQEIVQSVMTGALDEFAVRREAWRRTLLAFECGDDALAAAAYETFARHRRQSYQLFEDARALPALLAAGLPIGLITNGASDMQRDKLRVTGLDALITGTVVISAEAGVAKPDAAIFALALDRAGLQPRDVWYVGDNLTNDVGGAQGAGLTAIWLNRAGGASPDGSPVPDYEIASLSELQALLTSSLPRLP